MKKTLTALILVAAITSPAFSQSFGGSLSIFLPETLYSGGRGAISFEQGFSYGLGLAGGLSIPLGFTYFTASGYTAEHKDLAKTKGPSFTGDAIMPYAGLGYTISLGSLYIKAETGGTLLWAFYLEPTTEYFSPALAKDTGAYVAVQKLDIKKRIGYGYFAGGGLGVKIGSISAGLSAQYRNSFIPIDITADYSLVSGTSVTNITGASYNDAKAILKGISISIEGSFSIK